MWVRKRQADDLPLPEAPSSGVLKDAVRKTRIEVAEKSSVVVDLRDAELARLELLSDALDPLFRETPPELDLFDRVISRGDTPRLWIDAIAHVAMGRDKRHYRFVQDTRTGRHILAESSSIDDIVQAVTHYVASRIIEREQAMADASPRVPQLRDAVQQTRRRRRWRLFRMFVLGVAVGFAALFALLWVIAARH